MPGEKTTDRPSFDGFEPVPLRVYVRVGVCQRTLADLCRLAPGEVLLLDRRIGESFELMAAGCVLARVEPVGSEQGIALKVVRIAESDDDVEL